MDTACAVFVLPRPLAMPLAVQLQNVIWSSWQKVTAWSESGGNHTNMTWVNPLGCRDNYSATSKYMKLAVDGWAVTFGTAHYSDEGTGRGRSSPRPLIAVPDVTAHPSTASLPITVMLFNGLLLCGFNVPIKGLNNQCAVSYETTVTSHNLVGLYFTISAAFYLTGKQYRLSQASFKLKVMSVSYVICDVVAPSSRSWSFQQYLCIV